MPNEPLSSGRTWWGHFEFTRINIELTILYKKSRTCSLWGRIQRSMVQINKTGHLNQSVPVRTRIRSRLRRRHLTSRIPKNESGKRENEVAGLSGELLIGDDFLVARLGLGTMRLTGKGIWGEPPDRSEAIRVVRHAVELGVNFIDTADSYGPEVSENIIAEALYPYRADLVIATKGGLVRPGPAVLNRNGQPKHLRAACEGSLRRLRRDRIDVYQFHSPDPRVPL